MKLSDHQRLTNAKAVLQFAADCKLDVYITSLEYCLISTSDLLVLHKNSYELPSSNHHVQLNNLFDSVHNLTAQEDLLYRLKQRLINFAAMKSGHTKIFLGSTGTRLAGQLLTAMAQGRGAQIADEVVNMPRFYLFIGARRLDLKRNLIFRVFRTTGVVCRV